MTIKDEILVEPWNGLSFAEIRRKKSKSEPTVGANQTISGGNRQKDWRKNREDLRMLRRTRSIHR